MPYFSKLFVIANKNGIVNKYLFDKKVFSLYDVN